MKGQYRMIFTKHLSDNNSGFFALTAMVICCLLLFPAPARAEVAARPVVLFDEGHGQKFLVQRSGELDLSGLASVFSQRGSSVRTINEPLSSQSLSGADVLILSGPFSSLSEQEMTAIRDFIEKGGRLSVMLHIGVSVIPLLQSLGVDVSKGVINEQKGIIGDDPHNFQVSNLKKHPITRGLEQFSAHGVWAIMNFTGSVKIIALTSDYAWVDLDGNRKLSAGDAVQAFGVVVAGNFGKGRFAVFGDDAIFQNKFLTGDNLDLARYLADWLTGQ